MVELISSFVPQYVVGFGDDNGWDGHLGELLGTSEVSVFLFLMQKECGVTTDNTMPMTRQQFSLPIAWILSENWPQCDFVSRRAHRVLHKMQAANSEAGRPGLRQDIVFLF